MHYRPTWKIRNSQLTKNNSQFNPDKRTEKIILCKDWQLRNVSLITINNWTDRDDYWCQMNNETRVDYIKMVLWVSGLIGVVDSNPKV